LPVVAGGTSAGMVIWFMTTRYWQGGVFC